MPTKHTPGPWHVHAEITDKDSWVRTCRVVVKREGDSMWSQIADTRSSDSAGISGEEQQANAKLISAAPEMLEILLESIERLDGTFDSETEVDWIYRMKLIVSKATK